ncbi:MAG: TolC family protein [Cyclobacteriaceae bacterium]|nr:TolC family protein [Cyclobacteriaceae bacterium]
MKTLFIKSLAAGVFLLMPFALRAQEPLDFYIAEGLKHNLVLQQKNIALDKALLALKVANGMFAPSLTLLGNYTTGDGGRSISIPVGDMLNPVYATLNQLTGTDNFPTIENVNQNFFPRDFYDVRARAAMPLINTDLIYNKKIKAQQTLLQEFEVTAYKRELVRNIKVAYYNYLAAQQGVKIYESALARAEEGKRVNESLLENGKGLPAYILRSQSELESIKAQLADAERQVINAQLYFNFLLNREPQAAIDNSYPAQAELLQQDLTEPASQKREELLQLETATLIQQNVLDMTKLFWAPRLSAFADIGAQAERMKYNNNANYYLIGVQLEMPLFAGFTNRNRVAQSRLEVKHAELNTRQVTSQLNLSVSTSHHAWLTAQQNYRSAQKQLEAAQSYQRLIDKGYKEGANTFIEAIDARTQLTAAQLQLTLTQYRALIAFASLERETASYTFKN